MGRVAIVVNCSKGHYNLGAHKLTDWLKEQGHDVQYFDGDPGFFGLDADLVCLSVIFSWHAPVAREIALRMKERGAEVWCGGPGMFALAQWWKEQTGLEVTRGIDPRFDRQRGSYAATFASRGCPVGCYFCIVPKLEGTVFTLDWDFQPAPILCDNNLSALPDDFQDHVIDRYRAAGTLRDANSGFEPRTFTEETYRRWKTILKGPWRFALDETRELLDVERMMKVLAEESPKKKQVYVLIGNEPIEACYERALKVIEWGGEPYVQPLLPLNALSRDALKVRHDWTHQGLKDFARYFNRHLWRSFPIEEYRPRQREPLPFAGGISRTVELVQGGA